MTATEIPQPYDAALILADGAVFFGYGAGNEGTALGEICFNTAMTGYQEILTDPSYAGQIITFTFPHIGNVGTNDEDVESGSAHAKGVILREAITNPSNFRSLAHFDAWLKRHAITAISGIDTRALTRHIRTHGAQNVAITYKSDSLDGVRRELAAHPSMEGLELALAASTESVYAWEQTRWQLGEGYGKVLDASSHIVAIDYGEKLNILRSLASLGCKLSVVPAQTSAEDILKLKPDGVFLSNGPGDPAATGAYAVPVIQSIIEAGIPLFGICLGHQMLGLALGAKTEKMKQGHRGANHPIKNLNTGKVEITSQNHGFVISDQNLPTNVEVTHRSLFDNTIAGIALKDKPVFSVQYHPESSPGPHDSLYLFEQFVCSIQVSASRIQEKRA